MGITKGALRIYLGAAPGVGKTYAMLGEGRRGRQRGKDVVVGFVEPHGRTLTAEQIGDLEVVPRRTLTCGGTPGEEMDVDAVLARRPQLALVDELAHTNVPGSRNEKRWQDVRELLDAGIDVVSTMNIHHLESVNDVVERITGIKQHETIPDEIVRQADQVELVDMTPEALRRRMAHGNVYAPENIDAALANYFRPGNLGALRELALLWVADRVEEHLQAYMDEHGITGPWETRERVLVAVKGGSFDEQLIRRGARMAQRSRGDLLCAYVRAGEGLAGAPPAQVDGDRKLVQELGGVFHEVLGSDAARTLVEFARSEKVTQLVLGESTRRGWARLARSSVINKAIRLSGQVDVHVISEKADDDAAGTALPRARRRLAPVDARRTFGGFIVAIAGSLLLTLVFTNTRTHVGLPTVLVVYLGLVVVVAVVGGVWPALAAALVTSALANWFFTPPSHRWTISDAENVVALAVFVIVAAVVSSLMSVASRRADESRRAQAEADMLARAAAALIGHEDAIGEIVEVVRSAFGVDSAAILRLVEHRWLVESAAGEPVPQRPEFGNAVIKVSDDTRLVLTGRPLGSEDRRVLEAFAAQLGAALERRALASRASAADELEAASRLRTALLAGVSHDLRTPLASIKASVTSLLQRDVDWSPAATDEFLRTIDAESDRLNKLVGNMLDMSRLQTGSLAPSTRDVGLEEIVAPALAGLGERARSVTVDVPESLPRAHVDPALLERAIANVVDNAVTHSSEGLPVRVKAGEAAGRLMLRIVDGGPGIPRGQRERAFIPFQRLGDSSNSPGVGLGLAVAKGFVEAMGGTFSLDDTPGGGLTVTIELPITE